MATNIMMSMGTTAIQDGGNIVAAKNIADTSLLVEHYDDSDKGDFRSAMHGAAPMTRDLELVAGGGERDLLRFHSKIIFCSCLKEKYAKVKKE